MSGLLINLLISLLNGLLTDLLINLLISLLTALSTSLLVSLLISLLTALSTSLLISLLISLCTERESCRCRSSRFFPVFGLSFSKVPQITRRMRKSAGQISTPFCSFCHPISLLTLTRWGLLCRLCLWTGPRVAAGPECLMNGWSGCTTLQPRGDTQLRSTRGISPVFLHIFACLVIPGPAVISWMSLFWPSRLVDVTTRAARNCDDNALTRTQRGILLKLSRSCRLSRFAAASDARHLP